MNSYIVHFKNAKKENHYFIMEEENIEDASLKAFYNMKKNEQILTVKKLNRNEVLYYQKSRM